MSAESEQRRCKSPPGSLAPTTRLIQTAALSIVHPPWLFPAKVSMTQVPPCSLEGLRCSQIERTHHLEFFFPLIESNFSFPSFPTVMFLLDPFGPPTVPVLEMCRLEFPNITWSLTHFLNCQQFMAMALESPPSDSDRFQVQPSVCPHCWSSNMYTCKHYLFVPSALLSIPEPNLAWRSKKKKQNVAKQEECLLKSRNG